MKEYIIYAVITVVALLIGFIFGHFVFRKRQDGAIVIEMSEDGERERVRFVLELDFDELKDKKQISLNVENHLSQNSQPV